MAWPLHRSFLVGIQNMNLNKKIRSFICCVLSLAAVCVTTTSFGQVKALESDKAIVIKAGDKSILTYHKAVVQPPKGADPAYARSGFIHPIYSPKGGVVTGIHPKDHYHHMGLWHAWVKTKHKGRELDFWNLKKKNAAIRYAKTKSIHKGDAKGADRKSVV